MWSGRVQGRHAGFTLIELLVALGIMAMMAVLSWRGLDGMSRTQSQMRERDNQVMALQAGLSQWGADLDAIMQVGLVPELDWDGVVLRLTRRNSTAYAAGVLVVAWTRRAGATQGQGQWQRWQSPPVRTRGELETAWQQAQNWARNAAVGDRTREVSIVPLAQWQIFYFRNDAWSNPLSGGGVSTVESILQGIAVPEGVRLVLTLPEGQAISGTVVRDWLRPNVGGGKS
jgi:general secretion pathway protein J